MRPRVCESSPDIGPTKPKARDRTAQPSATARRETDPAAGQQEQREPQSARTRSASVGAVHRSHVRVGFKHKPLHRAVARKHCDRS